MILEPPRPPQGFQSIRQRSCIRYAAPPGKHLPYGIVCRANTLEVAPKCKRARSAFALPETDLDQSTDRLSPARSVGAIGNPGIKSSGQVWLKANGDFFGVRRLAPKIFGGWKRLCHTSRWQKWRPNERCFELKALVQSNLIIGDPQAVQMPGRSAGRYAEKLTLKQAPEPGGLAPVARPPPSCLAKADTTFIPRLLVLRSGSKSAGSPLPWSQTTISGPPG